MTRLIVKVGGASAGQAAHVVAGLAAAGNEICVVHGAGPQISQEMERRGLPVRFVDGRRYTTAEALEIVRASLAEVNASLCAALGPQAVASMGDDVADLPIFEVARLAIAVADAHPSVKSHAHFITQAHGGKGAVREVCDLILEAQRRSQP